MPRMNNNKQYITIDGEKLALEPHPTKPNRVVAYKDGRAVYETDAQNKSEVKDGSTK